MAWWPLHGLALIMGRPRLWWRPLVGGLICLLGLVLVGSLAAVHWWPSSGLPWGRWCLRAMEAIALALTAVLATWVVVVPLVMGTAMTGVARAVQSRAGILLPPDEGMFSSLRSSVVMLRRTWSLRVGWTLMALVGSLCGLPGVLVGGYGMAYMAGLDAFDTALASRGIEGARRLELIHAHRAELRSGALVAAALVLVLGVSVIGWWLLLPALVAGASQRVLTWPDLDAPTLQAAAPELLPRS